VRTERGPCVLALLAVLSSLTLRSLAAQTAADSAPEHGRQKARSDSATRVVVGGFVDSYYAYDFSRPRARDRAFTTQAARHAEFNINLAFVDLTLAAPRVRGRLALQTGTSVHANYAGEPRIGSISGPEPSRFIQEATAGYQLSPTLWVDAGILFSPFGSESWISRDNVTYTRSLVAENSPYYGAGVKAAWQATPALTAQFHVVNGWQNISETNSDKAIALRIDFQPAKGATVGYAAFVGNEQADSLVARVRVFQEVIVRYEVASRVQLIGTFDYGRQARDNHDGNAHWRGYSLVAQYRAGTRAAAGVRIERYADPEGVIVTTQDAAGLRASGASLNVDLVPAAPLLWRTELRGLCVRSVATRCPLAGAAFLGAHATIVTSIALTF
jgi:hypothetical protein